jgi:lipid-binding SYLF domain-containing protein
MATLERIRAMKTFSLLVLALVAATVVHGAARAASAAEIDANSRAALARLYATSPAAVSIGRRSHAILVFPKILKAGLIFGGAGGEGALYERGRATGFYSSVGGSWGLQAGVQTYSYVLFLMTPSARAYLDRSDGWSIGVGPTIVVVNQGGDADLSTTTAQADVIAFAFGQRGLMAGISLNGAKITRLDK